MKDIWTYDDNFIVNKDMVENGRFIKVKIPDIIYGDFDCSFNQLTSLEGGPIKVCGAFYCNHNKLATLEGGPEKVGEDFYCNDNNLTSLEGGPKEVGEYFYSNDNVNNLTIEAEFIKSGSFKADFYLDLLKYCLNEHIDLEEIKTWPENFITDNIKSSVEGICKFKL